MGPLNKNSKKLIFLFVIIAVVVVAVVAYFEFFKEDGTGHTDINSAQSSSSTQTSLVSVDTAWSSSTSTSDAAETSSAYFGEANTTQSVFARKAQTAVPSFSKEAFLVNDLTNNVDIAAMNADVRWPTASLTKLMTATLALDHLSLTTRITITQQMFAVDPDEGTLVVNGTYSVGDLLHMMLMPSSNVAAEALADYYGRAQFMAEMNARAKQWGMTNTYFDDPSGLSSANQSSAHDLAVLASHIYDNYPTIFTYSDTPSIAITELQSGAKIAVQSINQFAGTANFVGGKTGYIPQSGDNLLSIFRYNGKPVLIIVLGTAGAIERFGDTTKLLNWFTINYQ